MVILCIDESFALPTNKRRVLENAIMNEHTSMMMDDLPQQTNEPVDLYDHENEWKASFMRHMHRAMSLSDRVVWSLGVQAVSAVADLSLNLP